MTVADYSPRTVASYQREVSFLAQYFSDISLHEIQQHHIEAYLLYVKVTLGCARDKCRMAAQAFSFLYKHVLKMPFVLPSKLYPRKAFTLPDIMSPQEVMTLLRACKTIKQRALIELFYSTGVRLEECSKLKIAQVDSVNMCIHLHQGKGRKDRKMLLSPQCLATLRQYYKVHKPAVYLFEGRWTGKPMHPRAIQHALKLCFKYAGMKNKSYSAHTLRHSFATHLLDAGTDIHTIKELLGHSSIATTMVYLHLQTKKRQSLISPLDILFQQNTAAI